MISCKKATELVSQAVEHPISFRERLSLWFHLAICSFCREFAVQIRVIGKALRHNPELTSEEMLLHVPPEAREKLKRTLADKARELDKGQ